MNTKYETKRQENHWQHTFYLPSSWALAIVQAITAGITNAVVVAVTVVVALMVIFGGLVLAYLNLPTSVFTVIALVLAGDIILGIVVRAALSRKMGD